MTENIEICKAEDLACQVQDANPGNFAIEQEVAQLVGATVPAPTEPSADDARELPAQLLVFLRRALTPIQTALRTAVAAIYAHLDSRCTAYTPAAYDPFRLPAGPYDPMRPFVPRTLPNLLTALTAFSDRKISGVPEAPDGCSIPQLLLSPVRSEITEIEDNNEYTALSAGAARFDYWKILFPNLKKLTIGFRGKLTQALFGNCNIEEIIVCCEEVAANVCSSTDKNTTGLKHLHFPYMKRISGGALAQEHNGSKFAQLEDIDCPELESMTGGYIGSCCNGSHAGVKRIYMPTLKTMTGNNTAVLYITNSGCPNLIDIEVGEMTTNLVFTRGNSSTIMGNVLADASKTAELNANIRNHIAAKVSDRTGQSALTIYLPQAVRNALETATEDAFANKNWNISPARSN